MQLKVDAPCATSKCFSATQLKTKDLSSHRKIQFGADTWKAGNTLYTLADTEAAPVDSVAQQLCYSCRNVADAMNSQTDALPEFMQRRFKPRNVKSEIQEFLLDNEDDEALK